MTADVRTPPTETWQEEHQLPPAPPPTPRNQMHQLPAADAELLYEAVAEALVSARDLLALKRSARSAKLPEIERLQKRVHRLDTLLSALSYATGVLLRCP